MACRARPGVEADGPATEPKSKGSKKTDAGLPTWDGRPRKHDPASEVARAVHHEAVVRRRLAKLQRAVSIACCGGAEARVRRSRLRLSRPERTQPGNMADDERCRLCEATLSR